MLVYILLIVVLLCVALLFIVAAALAVLAHYTIKFLEWLNDKNQED